MAKAKAKTQPADIDQPIAKEESRTHYQEWEVKVTRTKDGPVAEKMKVLRPVVKITEEQAETLNHGRLHGGNTYTQMYFLPE